MIVLIWPVYLKVISLHIRVRPLFFIFLDILSAEIFFIIESHLNRADG